MFSLTLAATLVGFAGAAPAMAMGDDTGALNQVCLPLGDGKVDTKGDPMTVLLTAPEGMVITGYCVKAGSDGQGDGPEYPDLRPDQLNLNSFEISHSSGKAISHYSFSYAPAPTTPTDPVIPPKTVITEQPLSPTFVDECGYENDRYDVPLLDPANPKPYYYVTTVSIDGLEVKIQVIPSLQHEFAPGIVTSWPYGYTNVACEEVVVTPPAEVTPPTDITPPAVEVPVLEEEPDVAIIPMAATVAQTEQLANTGPEGLLMVAFIAFAALFFGLATKLPVFRAIKK